MYYILNPTLYYNWILPPGLNKDLSYVIFDKMCLCHNLIPVLLSLCPSFSVHSCVHSFRSGSTIWIWPRSFCSPTSSAQHWLIWRANALYTGTQTHERLQRLTEESFGVFCRIACPVFTLLLKSINQGGSNSLDVLYIIYYIITGHTEWFSDTVLCFSSSLMDVLHLRND